MKKALAAIVSLIIVFASLVSCGRKAESEAKELETTTAPTTESTTAEEVSLYKRNLKPVNLKDVNIDYVSSANMIYSHGGVDFCSVYRKDNKGDPSFYAITADKEILLTDQKMWHKFDIIKNKIYYYEILESVKKTDGKEYDKVAVWVMNLDGSNKKKLYDSKYKDIQVVYTDENYLYFSCHGLINSDEEIIYDQLCRYNFITKKTETIVDKISMYSCEYHNGKIVYTMFGTYFEDCYIRFYDLESGKITDTGLYSNYQFVDDDNFLITNENGERILYSLSKNRVINSGVFSHLQVKSWNGRITLKDNDKEESVYSYYSDGKTQELSKPSNPDYYLQLVLNKDEQFYSNAVLKDGKMKYQIIYMNDGKEAIVGESEWLEQPKDHDDINTNCYLTVGEFISIIYWESDDTYHTIRY